MGAWNRENGSMEPRKWEHGTEKTRTGMAYRSQKSAIFAADNLYNLYNLLSHHRRF